MKNAIIVHGMPSKEEYYDPAKPSMSNAHWLPWLQAQLLKHDIAAATPEIPHAYQPDWAIWSKEVERFDITPETLLVGHSCGAGFWVRWLSEHKDVKVGKVILVAPWLGYKDDGGIEPFFDGFQMDPYVALRTRGFYIFNADNDGESIQQSVKAIRETIPSSDYREFAGLGHFTSANMGKTEFPELLEELLAP